MLININIVEKYAEVVHNASLKNYTTLKIGGIAKYLLFPRDIDSLSKLLEYLIENNIDYKFLGKGSNLLCGDQEYDGCIIKLDKFINNFYFEDNYLIADAGCSIISLAYESAKKDLSGLEFASGIPATVGGCIYMNAGAYKKNIGDIVESVLVYYNAKLEWINKVKIEFGYRHSIFHDNKDMIIVAAKMKLVNGESSKIIDVINDRKKRRTDSQPLNYPSAGSVFKNQDENAWKYVEELGLRGFTYGGCKVSEKHANFIINFNDGTCTDFLAIVDEIQNKMNEKYGHNLIMEVEKFNC